MRNLPNAPGCYRMLNAKGDVLYVGKARDLKKRVTSYTQPKRQPNRIQRMIAETMAMEFVTTHTEVESCCSEGQSDQALRSALQCAAERRQELSLYPDHRRSPGAAVD